MRYIEGIALTRGETCCGQITYNPTERVKNSIFLTKELEMKDYAKVLVSKAIICENGGKTGHMTIICRILGITVLLIENATQIFKESQVVTISCTPARVFFGKRYIPKSVSNKVQKDIVTLIQKRPIHFQLSIVDERNIEWVNSLGPPYAREFFLREEFIWVKKNISPFAYFRRFGPEQTVELLVSNVVACLEKMKPGQRLNFRSLDIRSDEFPYFREGLALREANPQLGLHGIRQLLREQEFLIAELQAMDFLYDQGYHNITFSLPFINDQEELSQVKKLIKKYCNHDIKVGVFIETPSAVSELPFMIEEGVMSIYIGTKDLTQLILACDRGNTQVAHIYDTKKRPVVSNIKQILNSCAVLNVPVSLFTLYEDLPFFITNLTNLEHISLCCAEYAHILEHDRVNQARQLAA